MYTALLVVHLVLCAAIIVLVLMQQGKGADAGAAFGSGASGTVFGARGTASFLSKVTGVLAAGFFLTSLVLAMLSSHQTASTSVMQSAPQEQSSGASPALPAKSANEPAPSSLPAPSTNSQKTGN